MFHTYNVLGSVRFLRNWCLHETNVCDIIMFEANHHHHLLLEQLPSPQRVVFLAYTRTEHLCKYRDILVLHTRCLCLFGMMQRITNGLMAVPAHCLQPPARTTRGHSFKYQTLRSSCDKAKFSFFARTIPDWNKLPNTVVSAESISSFKRELMNHSTAQSNVLRTHTKAILVMPKNWLLGLSIQICEIFGIVPE